MIINLIIPFDHKPYGLIILNTQMQKTPTKIERLIMFPQKYDFVVNTPHQRPYLFQHFK